MKNFSTVGARLVVAALFSGVTAVSAQPLNCTFRADAPDQHLVVKGDTLWDISGKFLDKPWCWPQVWGMNRDEIKNPHWIYPGQIVYFDRVAGRLRLGQPATSGGGGSSNGSIPTVHMSPQIRGENLANNAITTIPTNSIEPFLSQPLILEE